MTIYDFVEGNVGRIGRVQLANGTVVVGTLVIYGDVVSGARIRDPEGMLHVLDSRCRPA
jgi:hypothetical protein